MACPWFLKGLSLACPDSPVICSSRNSELRRRYLTAYRQPLKGLAGTHASFWANDNALSALSDKEPRSLLLPVAITTRTYLLQLVETTSSPNFPIPVYGTCIQPVADRDQDRYARIPTCQGVNCETGVPEVWSYLNIELCVVNTISMKSQG